MLVYINRWILRKHSTIEWVEHPTLDDALAELSEAGMNNQYDFTIEMEGENLTRVDLRDLLNNWKASCRAETKWYAAEAVPR